MKNKILALGGLIALSLLMIGFVSAADVEINNVDQDTITSIITAAQNRDFKAIMQIIHDEGIAPERPVNKGPFENGNADPEHKALVESAIENLDYTAWVDLIAESNNPRAEELLSTINEENFSIFKELHEALRERNFERMQELNEELGLEQGSMNKEFFGENRGIRKNSEMQENREMNRTRAGNFSNCPFENEG